MSAMLYTVVAFVVAISVLVVVHEFGHYWVARRLGVKVLRFSVGFGRPLWSRRFGADQTEWAVAAIPLGGYVKMLDEGEGDVPAPERHRAFNRQPIWKRALIVLAGPAFNFFFAIGAYSGINMIGFDGLRPEVGKVAESSPASRAGFQSGDRLLSLDGRPVQSWDERRLYLYERALDQASVRFEVRDRDGVLHERVLDLASLSAAEVGSGLVERQIGLIPSLPPLLAVVGSLEVGGAAARAGLQVGDRVLAIDGQPIDAWPDLVSRVSTQPGKALRFTVQRGATRQDLTITPHETESAGRVIGRIGAGVEVPPLPAEFRVRVRYTPWQALVEGGETTWRMSMLTVKMLAKMVMLEVSTKTISGPLTIAQYAGASARVGLDSFVLFLAVVSVSLGVLNLLPVPVLDGGHLLFYLVEGVTGRPASERVLHWGQQVGLALLAALMALALYNDVMRLFN
jgi:regulator of sigma E protease